MYHYNFTNDLRISNLDSILTEASTAFITDTVPSAAEDKSKNNNFMTVGFYFNLKAKGNCAKLASKGNVKKVVLNFIKKFQFPNPRTPSDYENAKADNIVLAPMRDIVKLLHIFSLIDKSAAYLTKDEIKNFVFYNDDLAKRKNYNLLNTANQILEYRKNYLLPKNIDTNENDHIWNQPDRQIREMIKTLNYTGCFIEDEDGIKLRTDSIARDNEADLFEIINCNSYWDGNTAEEYQEYMDEGLELGDFEIGYEDELTRIYNLKKSKDFAMEAFNFLKQKHLLNNTVISNLTNLDFCKEELKCSYSILIKLPDGYTDENIKELSFVHGGLRYYQEPLKTADEVFITTNDWYDGTGTGNHSNNRITYINYIRSLLEGENKMTEKIGRLYNRIVFGAPGTGKSKLLADESEMFKSKKQQKNELEKIKMEFANVKSNENLVPQCAAIGFVYANQILKMKNDEINNLLQDFNPTQNVGYYMKVGAQVSKFYNLNESKEELVYEECPELIKQAYNNIDAKKNRVPQMFAIGLKFSDFIFDEFGDNSPRNQINTILGLGVEHASGYYITTGGQTLRFIKKLNSKDQANYEDRTVERVTFHPNYGYAQFVGAYKPVQDSDNEDVIRYEYVPGPFMRVYVNAVKEMKRAKEDGVVPQKYLLLIEEINRANMAAVFGDVFQLLDRKSDGNSDYPITISEDMKKYLARNGINSNELSIPSNMYIWATMNSADQGVLPMDAAFKRRWEFEYLNINNSELEIDENMNKLKFKDGEIDWNSLRHMINNRIISKYNVNEDKLLGPFFIKKGNQSDEEFMQSFSSKVLMYLFEDVCKMNPKLMFAGIEKQKLLFSDVMEKFKTEGLKIFNFSEEEKKQAKGEIQQSQKSIGNGGSEKKDSNQNPEITKVSDSEE